MVSRLSASLVDVYAGLYYSAGFQNTLEYHIPNIRAQRTTQTLRLKPGMSLKYDGDLYGLLTASGIASKYHWITMRVNDMTSPADYKKSITDIIIPDFDYIDDQFYIYRTSNNIQM